MIDHRGAGWATAQLGDVELEFEVMGTGPELVWLHGLSGNLEGERRMVEPLADEFRLLWFSSRGHGRSTPVLEASRYGYELFAEDLERLLDHVGFARPLIAGGSHGANTALRHELTHPGRARALCLIAPGANAIHEPDPQLLANLRQLTEFAASMGAPGLLQAATGITPDDPSPDPQTVAAFNTHDLDSLAAAMNLVIDQRAADPAALPGIAVPTHVVAWDADPFIHPIATAREIVALVPGATFEEVPAPATMAPAEAAALGTDVIRRWARAASAVPIS